MQEKGHRNIAGNAALLAAAWLCVVHGAYAQGVDEPPPPPPPELLSAPTWTVGPPVWTEHANADWGYKALLSSAQLADEERTRHPWGLVEGARTMGSWPEIRIQRLTLLPTRAGLPLDSLVVMLRNPSIFTPTVVTDREAVAFDGAEALRYVEHRSNAPGMNMVMLLRRSPFEALAFTAWLPAQDTNEVQRAIAKFFASVTITDNVSGRALQARPRVLADGVRFTDDTVGYAVDMPFFPERRSTEALGTVRMTTDWSGDLGLPLVAATAVVDRRGEGNPGMTLDAGVMAMRAQMTVLREQRITVDGCPAALLEMDLAEDGTLFAIVIDAPGDRMINVMVDPGPAGEAYVRQVMASIAIRAVGADRR